MKRNITLILFSIFIHYSFLGQTKTDQYIAKNLVSLTQNASSITFSKKASLKKVQENFQKKLETATKKSLQPLYIEFRKDITSILSFEQFSAVFDSMLSKNSSIMAEKRVENNLNSMKLSLSPEQRKEYKTILLEYTRKEYNIWQYYAYQPENIKKYRASVIPKKKKATSLYLAPFLNKKNKKDDTNEIANLDVEINSFKELAKQKNISQLTIDKVVNLYSEYGKRLKALSEKKKQNKEASFIFEDSQSAKNLLRKNLKNEIKSSLAYDEFKSLFRDKFSHEIAEKRRFQFQTETKGLDLTNEQAKRLEDIINYYSEKLIVGKKYYGTANYGLKKVDLIKREYKTTLENAFDDLGISSKQVLIKDKKITKFIAKAKEAGLEDSNIDNIKEAYMLKEKKIQEFKKEAKNTKRENLIVLSNITQNIEREINNSFKKSLANNLTLNQFGIIFKDQLIKASQILTNNQVEIFRSTYNFGKAKNNIIIELITDQTFKEILLNQYYSYDRKLMNQKLRASQYHFEKRYSKKIREFQSTN